MTDHFGVRPEDLIAHGGHVQATADSIEQARAAGQATRPSSDAYGQLCSMVPAMLSALQSVLLDGIADAAAAVRETGDKVHLVAQDYALTDEDNADDFRSLHRPLP